jgi:hypothetical protein
MPRFEPEHTPAEADAFTGQYLDTAEWLLDEEIDRDTIKGWAPEAVEAATADCRAFLQEAAAPLAIAYEIHAYTEEQAAHDFWLTRNRHGAGFWDRGLDAKTPDGKVGNALTDIAHAYGEADAYQGDDGYLYLR